MIPDVCHITLSDADHAVTLLGYVGEREPTGFVASSLSGFYSMPDLKVTQTERKTGNGAHDVPEQEVLYAARTVTLGCVVMGDGRAEVMRRLEELLRFSGRNIRMAVADGERETYCEGHCRLDVGDVVSDEAAKATLTLVCPRPERLSSEALVLSMEPSAGSTDGLQYTADQVLVLPLDFGEVGSARNGCTIVNDGTSTAYPTITAIGDFPSGVAIYDRETNEALVYPMQVGWQGIEFDCRSRIATSGGVDVTRHLTQRHFPTVRAGGSVSLFLSGGGSGTVTCTIRDTYI